MKRIWKYSVPITDSFAIRMPQGATILSLQMQRDEPTIWVLVEEDAQVEIRRFRYFGTGHPIHINLADYLYVGSIQMESLVFHLFAEKTP